MKSKLLFMRFNFCAILIFAMLPTMATKLKIVNMAPNQKIRIGARECGIGDTFDANDTIYWNTNLDNQAFKVVCIKDCKEIPGVKEISNRNCSKHENERKGGMNMSFATLVGMVSKGDANEEPIILWPGELILVEGITADAGYTYYCRVKSKISKLPVVVKDNNIYLNSDDFKNYGLEMEIEIYQASKTNAFDIQIIKVLNAEQVK